MNNTISPDGRVFVLLLALSYILLVCLSVLARPVLGRWSVWLAFALVVGLVGGVRLGT